MQAAILAAGKSSRFRKTFGANKLLQPLFGMPLLKRTLLTARYAGINDFFIVVGYEKNKIKRLLGNGKELGVKIHYIENPDWEKENGISFFKLKGKIMTPFLLLMGDHVMEPDMLKEFLKTRLYNGESALAVDYKLNKVFDLPEATKVLVDKKGRIRKIGKKIKKFNAVDTGVFLINDEAFEVAEKVISSGKEKLSEIMQALTEKNYLKGVDIGPYRWVDVDTAADYRQAEKLIFKKIISGKPTDGWVSRNINRKVSTRITKLLAYFGVNPNQITLASFLIISFSALPFFLQRKEWFIPAAFLAQFGSIVDGCDGELARLQMSMTSFGAWFDSVLDRIADTIFTAGVSYYVFITNPSPLTFLLGSFALAGSIMTSYSAKEYKLVFGKTFQFSTRLFKFVASSRDIRIFILFLGILLNKMLLAIGLVALLTNLSVLLRFLDKLPTRSYLK